MRLELTLRNILDNVVLENFKRLNSFINGQRILQGNLEFFEADIPGAYTAFPIKHNLSFTPKDIILLHITGDHGLHFRYQEFDSDFIYVKTNGPCLVRFLAGSFRDSSYGNKSVNYPYVAP